MDLSLLFPLLILLLFIPIFLSGRRQRRQMQEMQNLQQSLEVGDVVMTTSGLRATVVDTDYEDTIDLEIADGVVTTWVRAAVREKVQPVAGDATDSVTTDSATTDSVASTAGTTTSGNDTVASAIDGAAPRTDAPSLEKDRTNGTPRS